MRNTQARFEHEYCRSYNGCPTQLDIALYLKAEIIGSDRFGFGGDLRVGSGIFQAALDNITSPERIVRSRGRYGVEVLIPKGAFVLLLDHGADPWLLEPWDDAGSSRGEVSKGNE